MSEPLKFHLVTDTHLYASSLAVDPADRGQICRAESGAIIDAAFDLIAEDKDAGIVLLAGDLVNSGEKEGHYELLEKLRGLKARGKRIYLITATHDYDRLRADIVKKDGSKPTQTERDDLPVLYHDFGFNEALSADETSYSYCVKLQEGYRLLCLNDDGDGRSFCGYSETTMDWILGQIKEAHAAGNYIFAMTHHPLVPPTPIYPIISRRDMLGNYEETAETLADAGLEFMFTGHSHMHNIAVRESAKGNKIYDINTASLVGYPSAIRKVTIDGEKADIQTLQISDFNWDRGGLSVEEYLKRQFDSLLVDIFDAAANDLERFVELANGFSVSRETVEKLKRPITLGGKVLQRLTVGGVGRLLFIGGKIDKSIRKVKVKDLFIEIIRNLYHGDEPHAPGTPVYGAFDALTNRLTPVIKRFVKKPEGILDLMALIKDGVLYDAPPSDWSAALLRVR